MLIHNSQKATLEKKAWLAVDAVMLTIGVGELRLAWSAANVWRKIMIAADISSSSVSIFVNLAPDKYIPKDVKQRISVGCALLQAPEAIRSLSEVVQALTRSKDEVNDLLRLESRLDPKSRNALQRYVAAIGNNSADELADAAETLKRMIGLLLEERGIVLRGLNAITDDSKIYLAIHGEGEVFKVFQKGEVKDFSHRSLAKYINDNFSNNGNNLKDIVLLSCSDANSAQNLANKLGGNRKVIAWEGEVEIFENGYIRGNGACKEFSPSTNGQANARTLSSTETPKGRNELPTFTGANRTKRVVLSAAIPPSLSTKLDAIIDPISGLSGREKLTQWISSQNNINYVNGSTSDMFTQLANDLNNKNILEVVIDQQGRLSFVIQTNGVSHDLISIQKNVQGKHSVTKYSRAYNRNANVNIDAGVSQNRLVPDYTKDMAGNASTRYLYPQNLLPSGKSPVVRIKMSGKRGGLDGDFHLANKAAGIDGTFGYSPPTDYTWHHMDDFTVDANGDAWCTMQLVLASAHTKVEGMTHSGSVAQWKAYFIDKSIASSLSKLFYAN